MIELRTEEISNPNLLRVVQRRNGTAMLTVRPSTWLLGVSMQQKDGMSQPGRINPGASILETRIYRAITRCHAETVIKGRRKTVGP